MSLTNIFNSSKNLLRGMLDPAAEKIQYAKKQWVCIIHVWGLVDVRHARRVKSYLTGSANIYQLWCVNIHTHNFKSFGIIFYFLIIEFFLK